MNIYTIKTAKAYTSNFREFGNITVPANTGLTHQTAAGIDKEYHFVDDFGWVNRDYPTFANILRDDMQNYGLNVPVEYVEYMIQDTIGGTAIRVINGMVTFAGIEVKKLVPPTKYANKFDIISAHDKIATIHLTEENVQFLSQFVPTTPEPQAVNTKSIYERWNDGEYFCFGSFTQSLLETYRKADYTNSKRLAIAFPEYFNASTDKV